MKTRDGFVSSHLVESQEREGQGWGGRTTDETRVPTNSPSGRRHTDRFQRVTDVGCLPDVDISQITSGQKERWENGLGGGNVFLRGRGGREERLRGRVWGREVY